MVWIDPSRAAAIAGLPQLWICHDLGDPFRLTFAAHIGLELREHGEHAHLHTAADNLDQLTVSEY